MTPAGFPHSDTPGSTLGCQLPRAYRRLLRPSSALDAKASTMCPSQLVTHTTNAPHPEKPDGPDMAVHTTHYKDARVHYPDLKQQPHTGPTTPTQGATEPARYVLVPKPQTTPRPPTTPTTPAREELDGTDGQKTHGRLIPQNPNSVPPPTSRHPR